MANGVSTSLGYSIPQVGGMYPRAEFYDSVSGRDNSLMYEYNLSSYPPMFYKGQFISPLEIANAPFYSKFGLKKPKKKVDCKKFLKNKSVSPTTGRPIKRGGIKYKNLNKDCTKKITKKMCEKFNVPGYPYVVLDNNGEHKPYSGERTAEALLSFVSLEK